MKRGDLDGGRKIFRENTQALKGGRTKCSDYLKSRKEIKIVYDWKIKKKKKRTNREKKHKEGRRIWPMEKRKKTMVYEGKYGL